MARILIIDQHPWDTVLEVLREEGHQVLVAATGRAGTDFAAESEPELVLLELALPDATGIELCDFFRTNHPRTVVIVLSSAADEDSKVSALLSGADDYLAKQIGHDELRARIRAALRRGR